MGDDSRFVWAACLDPNWDDKREFDGWNFEDTSWDDPWDIEDIDLKLEKACQEALNEGAWGYAGE